MPLKEIRAVGVIGLGRMGLPMARHLVAAGFDVRAFDVQARARAAAESVDIPIPPSCRAVAGASDAVLVVVGSESEVERAVSGADGIIHGAKPGTVLMIAATIAPNYAISLARRVEPHGLRVADVPVARGEAAADAGRLLVFAGGAAEVLDRCDPVLTSFADRVCRVGDVGAGQAAKAINNMLLWACLCASVEGLDLGEAMGVDRETLRAALLHGSGANWALETRADGRPALWAEKDMAIVLQEAERLGVAAPVSETVTQAIRAFKAARGLPAAPTDRTDVPT